MPITMSFTLLSVAPRRMASDGSPIATTTHGGTTPNRIVVWYSGNQSLVGTLLQLSPRWQRVHQDGKRLCYQNVCRPRHSVEKNESCVFFLRGPKGKTQGLHARWRKISRAQDWAPWLDACTCITRQPQWNCDYRATSFSEHPLGDRTQEHACQAGSTPRAHHDEIRPKSRCLIEDASNGRTEY